MQCFTTPRLAAGAIAGATALALLAAQPASAAYDGRPGRIAFGAFDATDRRQSDIWSARPAGGDLHRLTDAPGRDICPAYSADGRRIAFCSDRTGAFEIWVMDANGGHERQLTSLGTSATFPDFSPDGSRIAFSAQTAGTGDTDVWTVPSRGGTPTRVTDTPDTPEDDPVWSPDGSRILFVRFAGDFSSSQLWTVDVASGVETRLTSDATFKDQTPDWSPDGTRITYTADDDVWLMDDDGSDQVNLTHSASVEFGATFSPDGRTIAFTGSGGPVPAGQRYVQTIRTDGSDRRVVRATPGRLQAVPAWQPLGSGR